MIATSKKIRFTIDEYLRMDEAGIFDGKRVELIGGRIYRMNARAHPHRWAVSKAASAFFRLFPSDRHWVVVQGTLPLGRFGAPEPDIYLLDVPQGTEEALTPKPSLVVEISEKSYRKDSGVKLRLYAAAGIREYWIVNLIDKRIEVYRMPKNSGTLAEDWRYDSVHFVLPGESIVLSAFPQVAIPASDLLP